MSADLFTWHERYSQQAAWTFPLRQFLYQRAGLREARRVLDVGCGTGVLFSELSQRTSLVYGVDKERQHLDLATQHKARLICADAHQLPYQAQAFDITLCHFVLLWVNNPVQAVREMARVTRPGGSVLALAEPDYGGRIDHPPELTILGNLQSASLRRQGADPHIGRKLAGIFQQAGLQEVETGVLGGQWDAGQLTTTDWELEWHVLENDLKQISEDISASDITNLRELDRQARQRGERVLFVPTFWAWGKV